jgi:hypothetical protein
MKCVFFVLLMTVTSLNAATIAHYKFGNPAPNTPLYELTDSSGNGHHGRVLGQELFELTTDIPPFPGVSDDALDLRGRLDYAVIPHHSHFAPSGDWTIEFFIKVGHFHQESGGATNIAPGFFYPSVNTNLAYTILYKQNTNQPTRFGSAWAFHYVPANGQVVFTMSYGANQGELMVDAADLRGGEWHHIAVVFAASAEYEIRFFHNGFRHQSHNLGNVPFSWGDGPIYVGAWARQNNFFTVPDRNFDGKLDEIRFSNAALDAESFVVNFVPLFPAIPVEAYRAIELQFEAEAGNIYRIEQIDPATGAYRRLGYLAGEGGLKSFFYRDTFTVPSGFRVVADTENPTAPVPFTTHDAIELRFPTRPGQLYLVVGCDTLRCQHGQQTFLLGDGAKMSHFQRAADVARFYTVERY